MTKPVKKKKLNEAVEPQATLTDASSKSAIMAQVVNGMANLSAGDLTKFFTQWQAMIGHEADSIPDGTADKNLASVNSSGAIKEDLGAILNGETLSEEIKEKTAVLFEAAVATKVGLIKAELEEQYETRLNEEIDTLNTTLAEQVDEYLTYVAKKYIKENRTAVRNSIRTELAEDFIRGMKSLFDEHYVSIPEDQVDAVEALSEEVRKVKEINNSLVQENIEKTKQLESYLKEQAIKEVSEGLAMTQVEKLKKLCEGVDFNNDVETFKKKVKILREEHIDKKGKTVLSEATPGTEKVVSDGGMKKLRDFMVNSVKN